MFDVISRRHTRKVNSELSTCQKEALNALFIIHEFKDLPGDGTESSNPEWEFFSYILWYILNSFVLFMLPFSRTIGFRERSENTNYVLLHSQSKHSLTRGSDRHVLVVHAVLRLFVKCKRSTPSLCSLKLRVIGVIRVVALKLCV